MNKTTFLDRLPANHAVYDVVYSWGVLHYTGDIWQAIKNAAAYVAPDGRFIIALYKKSPSCGFWRIEKAIYSRLPTIFQLPVTLMYSVLYLTTLTLTGKNPIKYVKTYKNFRGMDFWHDAIELGGYPYESASPSEVKEFFSRMGLTSSATST